MAGQSSIQNFSLPSRTGSIRPFSPSVSDGRDSPDGDSDPGTATSLNFDHNLIRPPTSGLAPASSALQLFHFTDDTTARTARRSRVLPRPMSTSSSAPALTGLGDNKDEQERLNGAIVSESQTQAILTDGTAAQKKVDGLLKNEDESGPSSGPQQTPKKTRTTLDDNCPTSPTLSVWPRPMSVLDRSPGKQSQRSGKDKKRTGDSLCSRTYTPADTITRTHTHDLDRDLEGSIDNEPPSLARSISIRWGPRIRHISLSEVQAADDAARRVASVRRERRVFWFLVALALVGVLSCTGAVTLAAAQAAMQAGVEEIGPDENGGGPIWDSRTLGWLVASLLVCATAAIGLAVATSARCRRRRDAASREDTYSSPGEKAMLAQLVQTSTGGGGRGPSRDRECGGGSRCSHRFSALFSSRAPQHQDADGNTRETRESRAGWIEMDDMDEQDGQGRNGGVSRWWSLKRHQNEGSTVAVFGSTENSKSIAGNDGSSDGVLVNKDLPTPNEAPIREEDRNWDKFSQDPVQLRRYVETLETRLAVVEGVQRVRSATETEVGEASARTSQPGFVRSPAMALLPRELMATPDTEKSTGGRWFAGPWNGK
ncbi:hypothetical protein SBRCBS47491_005711 [Sporothrix bragantina]|uniref:Transmembrane protein n=1 Tax=Sporothrix bragantina TaxID=671064 RepID=A0ABP0C133_9PEZI